MAFHAIEPKPQVVEEQPQEEIKELPKIKFRRKLFNVINYVMMAPSFVQLVWRAFRILDWGILWLFTRPWVPIQKRVIPNARGLSGPKRGCSGCQRKIGEGNQHK